MFFLTGLSGLRGDEPPAVQVDLTLLSRRVFRGVERAGASVQAAAQINRDNFRGDLWTSRPFAGGEAREAGLQAAYSWQPVEAINLSASVAQRWFSGVPGGGVRRSLESGLVATWAPVSGFTPRVGYYHDFRFRADTGQISLARSVALVKWGAFLELNFYAGWAAGSDWRPDAPGPQRRDSYGYWGGEAQLPYRIGAHSTVTAGVHYAGAFGRSAGNGAFGLPARQNLWLSFGVNLDF